MISSASLRWFVLPVLRNFTALTSLLQIYSGATVRKTPASKHREYQIVCKWEYRTLAPRMDQSPLGHLLGLTISGDT